MSVLSMLACATSDTEAVFVAKVDGGGPVRIAYTTTEPDAGQAMAEPVFSVPVVVDALGLAKVAVGGLTTGTRYWWRVEDAGTVEAARTATFLTPPPAGAPASFTFTASGDAGLTPDSPGFTGAELRPDLISNHEIHKHIAERMIAEDWIAHVALGDSVYYNFGDTAGGYPAATVDNLHRGYDDLQIQPNQVALFDAGSYIHVEDDHDGVGGNNADGTHADWPNFATVYRLREAHHPLPETGAIYRSFMWGRALVVIWDCRYYRSPSTDPDGPTKTMLGSAQKAWFQGLMASTTAEAIIIVSSVPWTSGGDDSWPGYATERAEIADMITGSGKAGRVVMLSADAHRAAIDTGSHNAWGGWPTAIFAARDATPSPPDALSGMYDIIEQGGRAQYGTVTVADLGSLITVRLTAWRNGNELASYTKAIATSTPTVATDVTDLISGSHQVVFEARVVTDYQTGPDPTGETIPVRGGDVQYDATAETWSTASVGTIGINEDDLTSAFPRFPDDPLMPYGNEVFLRYGIDTGASVLWTPLGYYRIDDTEQTDDSDAPIRLTGADRWAGLAEAKLVLPRQYRSTMTIAAVVYDLVLDVYPGAIVAWDDTDEQLPLGRDLIVEKDRAAALRDIATSRGKIVYFDSEGILRVETVPDPDDIVWDIKAGARGVLVSSSRRVSRSGMYNGIVATGQGATESPALGIVVDVGPDSPTRWGGRFGKKPDFYSSPLLTDNVSARAAATSLLRRRIGKPQSADFGVIPNPTLRPLQAVRIAQKDGNRDRHIVQTLTVPLAAGQNMTGTTKQQTYTRLASLLPGEATGQIDPGE